MSATTVHTRPRRRSTTTTRTEKGLSLARGPAHLVGTVLLVAGLYTLCKAHAFPAFSQLPNGHVVGQKIFFSIFRVNGWTGMLTAIAGGALLFGAAQHLLAKTVSLVVGAALGAAAVIAVISGNVLGMAAANGWTELVWAGAAVILLFNVVVPRLTRTVVVDQPQVVTEPTAMPARPAPAVATRPVETVPTTSAVPATPHTNDLDPATTVAPTRADEARTTAIRTETTAPEFDSDPVPAREMSDDPKA